MKKAFTLIELILTIGILGLLLSVIISFSNNTLISANFNTTVNDIRQAILNVNNRALNSYENSDQGIRFEANQYTIFVGSSFDVDATSNDIFEIPSSISLSNINFDSGSDLVFNQFTGIPVDAGSFDITSNKGDSATISIDVNGVTSVSYN